MKICVIPGDGIGVEICAEAVRVIDALKDIHGLKIEYEYGLLGGAAYDQTGRPLPVETLRLADEADAILLGAVGGPKWDKLPAESRPERGLLGIRKYLGLNANLRPIKVFAELANASTLRPEVVSGLDMMIVRELTGDIYFGQPRGIRTSGFERVGYNTMEYSESEIALIAEMAFRIARKRRSKVMSVDKMNVLECMQLWRDVVTKVGERFPDVTLEHMLVDNAAMQLVKNPKQFDVLLTGNMFGDILSDEAAMLTGSIGMLPSASLNVEDKGMYEPCHGSAPDIAGQDIANPLGMILSAAMMFRYSLGRPDMAEAIEAAVQTVLTAGARTKDIYQPGDRLVSTSGMGGLVVGALRRFT
ncbi:MAG: 3-isopropylmalate dehydrogenase [Proteobacteria bacterium]|nr:3-isopropylmalate dehydrogenase [Pseudomonadota bacterium]